MYIFYTTTKNVPLNKYPKTWLFQKFWNYLFNILMSSETMEKRIKPSDIKKMAEICKKINKSLNFDNPIIEGKQLTKESKRFKKLFEYSIPNDEKRSTMKDSAVKKDDDDYEDVVFLQGDESIEALDILQNEGEDEALEYLKQWHFPGEHPKIEGRGIGSSDKTYEKDGYIMFYNTPLEYIGLMAKSI